MLCGTVGDLDLRLIESIFYQRPSSDVPCSDTLTVCVTPCADEIRNNSEVIVRDEPFKEGMK